MLAKETIVVLGYGAVRPRRSILKTTVRVITCQSPRFKADWDRARADGWGARQDIVRHSGEAVQRGTIIQMLVSDAAQKQIWPTVKTFRPGAALYFSHGFSIVYGDQTKVIPPSGRGCGLRLPLVALAPPCAATSSPARASVPVTPSSRTPPDAPANAAWPSASASARGTLFPTTFEREVYSDLTGERGMLMAALAGVMEAQYDVLRANGHSPSEAFNETVEELTQSLIRLVDENGMDWMFANCSATAQRGALDWKPKFKKKPPCPCLNNSTRSAVKTGKETRRVLAVCGQSNYPAKVSQELAAIRNSEMWQAGLARATCAPRRKRLRALDKNTKGIKGRSA